MLKGRDHVRWKGIFDLALKASDLEAIALKDA